MKYLYAYLIFINVLSFLLFAIDKHKAIKKKWRIRESVLLFAGFIGGALGGIIAMYTVRHKTQTLKFVICMPLFLILHIALIGFCIYKGIINF